MIGIGAISVGIDQLPALFRPETYFWGLPPIIISFVIVLVLPFAISAIPAFFSGMLLAYWFSRAAQHNRLTARGGVRMAAFIGFAEGAMLTAILSPVMFDLQSHPAHNLPAPPVGSVVLNMAVFACIILVMTSLVGAWSGRQIVRSYVKN